MRKATDEALLSATIAATADDQLQRQLEVLSSYFIVLIEKEKENWLCFAPTEKNV